MDGLHPPLVAQGRRRPRYARFARVQFEREEDASAERRQARDWMRCLCLLAQGGARRPTRLGERHRRERHKHPKRQFESALPW